MNPRLLDLPHGHQTVIDEADWPLVQNLRLYRGLNGYVYYSVWADGKSMPYTLHGLRYQKIHRLVDHDTAARVQGWTVWRERSGLGRTTILCPKHRAERGIQARVRPLGDAS